MRLQRWFGYLVIFHTVVFLRPAFAQDVRWTHYGVRPLAMGNAFVAVSNDYNALFYNPAGIARLDDWYGELINPGIDISLKTKNVIQKVTGGDEDYTNLDDTKKMLDVIEKEAGTVHHVGVNWTPHLIFPRFGLGIGLDVGSLFVFHRYPSAYIKAGPELIFPLSFGKNFLEDRLSVGFNVKYRVKGGVDHEFSIQDIEAFTSSEKDSASTATNNDKTELKDFVQGGQGYGCDVGILFTPVKTMAPTLGVSITDIGGTPYNVLNVSDSATLGAPKPELPSVNVGMSIKPWQTETMYLLSAVDMHSINQPFSYSKKLNLGLEWGFGRIIKIQAGLHQGYLTGGFQFDVRLLKIRFATYAEEMGAVAGTLQDRRYALQLKVLI
ncbi:MAG: hypothetical protein HQK54_00380 [Oligoflexales bacterium]|nr:hypothetical protein [Oligoflexales bacterium]